MILGARMVRVHDVGPTVGVAGLLAGGTGAAGATGATGTPDDGMDEVR
jgi:hypothetical protein